MAKQSVALDVNVNLTGDDAIAYLDAIAKKAKEGKQEVEKLGSSGSFLSKLKEQAQAAEKALDGVGSVQRAEAVLKVSEGLVGGFTAAQGAMALFGEESEELQKTMLKVQSALAISQGVKMVTEGIHNMGTAFNTLKKTILENPIFTLVTVITAITVALAAWISSEADLLEQIKKSRQAEEERFRIAQISYDTQIEKARALGEETATLERQKTLDALKNAKIRLELLELERKAQARANATISDRIAVEGDLSKIIGERSEDEKKAAEEILKIEGELEVQLINNFKEVTAASISSNNEQLAATKKRIEAQEKAEKEAFEKRKKADQELNEQLADSEKLVQDQRTKNNQKQIEEVERQIKTLPETVAQSTQEALEIQISAWEAFQAYTANFGEFLNGKFGQAATGIMNTITSGITLVSNFQKNQEEQQLAAAEGNAAKQEQIRRKFFERQKKLQIAQAFISTYQSATEAYKATVGIPVVGPVLAPIAAGAALAAGLLNINNIRKQTYEGGGGGGGSSMPAPGLPEGAAVTAPPINNYSGQSFIPGQENNNNNPTEQRPTKVYVVATDIIAGTNEIKATVDKATFS